MKTYEEIEHAFKFIPAQCALNRLKNKKATTADKHLIGSIVGEHYQDPYLLEFDPIKKRVLIGHCWDSTTKKYYKLSCFYVPDAFQGI